MQQPQGDNPNRRQAIQLTVQAHLQEYQALRQQIVEWTRLEFVMGTAMLAAAVVVFAFLTDESRSPEPTIFLALPFVFAFFGAYAISFAASNVAVAGYITVVAGRTRQLVRLLDNEVPVDLVLAWEEFQRGLLMGQEARKDNPLFRLVQAAIWFGASGLAWGLFFNERPDPTRTQWLLLLFGGISNFALLVWALYKPRKAERDFLTVREEWSRRVAAADSDETQAGSE